MLSRGAALSAPKGRSGEWQGRLGVGAAVTGGWLGGAGSPEEGAGKMSD